MDLSTLVLWGAEQHEILRPSLVGACLSLAAMMFASHTLLAVTMFAGFYRDSRTLRFVAQTRDESDWFGPLEAVVFRVRRSSWAFLSLALVHLIILPGNQIAVPQPLDYVRCAALVVTTAWVLWTVRMFRAVYRFSDSWMDFQKAETKNRAEDELAKARDRRREAAG